MKNITFLVFASSKVHTAWHISTPGSKQKERHTEIVSQTPSPNFGSPSVSEARTYRVRYSQEWTLEPLRSQNSSKKPTCSIQRNCNVRLLSVSWGRRWPINKCCLSIQSILLPIYLRRQRASSRVSTIGISHVGISVLIKSTYLRRSLYLTSTNEWLRTQVDVLSCWTILAVLQL